MKANADYLRYEGDKDGSLETSSVCRRERQSDAFRSSGQSGQVQSKVFPFLIAEHPRFAEGVLFFLTVSYLRCTGGNPADH